MSCNHDHDHDHPHPHAHKPDDRIVRHVEKGVEDEGLSPMSAPEAYAPPSKVVVPYDELHPCLQQLTDEHKPLIEKLKVFEQALVEIQERGLSPSVGSVLRDFYKAFEEGFPRHSRKEELGVFALLRARLIAIGEHSPTAEQKTGVDVLEDDHVKALQLAAVSCAYFGLAVRLPDEQSGLMTLSSAVQQARALIELVRLHIFREENIIFGLAQKHLTSAELDRILHGPTA